MNPSSKPSTRSASAVAWRGEPPIRTFTTPRSTPSRPTARGSRRGTGRPKRISSARMPFSNVFQRPATGSCAAPSTPRTSSTCRRPTSREPLPWRNSTARRCRFMWIGTAKRSRWQWRCGGVGRSNVSPKWASSTSISWPFMPCSPPVPKSGCWRTAAPASPTQRSSASAT